MSWLTEIPKVLWLSVPVLIAAAVQIVVIKVDALKFLKKPMDFGKSFRGRRIFGDNKTWRGAVVYIAVACVARIGQAQFPLESAEYPGWASVNPALLGALLGLGYVLGELPNSFVKRRRDIGPGQRGSPVFVILDQIDSIIGVLVVIMPVWIAPLRFWVVALVLCTGIHIAFNAVFVLLGLKKSVF